MRYTVAVLGAGGWGTNWLERALRDPDCEILAVADANPEVLARLAARGVPEQHLFASADEALSAGPTDLVTCSIPNPHRLPGLVRALAEGRHILADKPLVHTADALETLLQAGRGRKSVLMVAQNYRLFHGVRRIAELLRGGAIGPVGSMHVHFLRSHRVVSASHVRHLPGIAAMGLEMCIHHFDLMRCFLDGATPEAVDIRGWRTPWSPGAGLDGLAATLEFPGGVRVAYDASWGAAYDATDWNGHWEILGPRGTISYGASGRALRVYDESGAQVEADPGANADDDTTQSVDGVWARFKQAVADVTAGRTRVDEVFCSPEDNAKSLAIALGA